MDALEETLPIFPLSNVVLFPRVQVPLHLFEPRYRQLADAAVEGTRRIGMVVVQPDQVAEMSGDPPIFPVGCAGDVIASEKLPDGRWNIVLQGTGRFRVLEELPRDGERLYRLARVARLEDRLDESDAPRVTTLREGVVELMGELMRLTGSEESELPESFLQEVDDAAFANALCNALAFPTAEKQGLLEADTIADRMQRLSDLLAFRRKKSQSIDFGRESEIRLGADFRTRGAGTRAKAASLWPESARNRIAIGVANTGFPTRNAGSKRLLSVSLGNPLRARGVLRPDPRRALLRRRRASDSVGIGAKLLKLQYRSGTE